MQFGAVLFDLLIILRFDIFLFFQIEVFFFFQLSAQISIEFFQLLGMFILEGLNFISEFLLEQIKFILSSFQFLAELSFQIVIFFSGRQILTGDLCQFFISLSLGSLTVIDRLLVLFIYTLTA